MTPSQALQSYRRAMSQVGETVTVRRYAGKGPARTAAAEADALARIMGFEAKEIVGAVQQVTARSSCSMIPPRPSLPAKPL
jgi:hypothetical protein